MNRNLTLALLLLLLTILASCFFGFGLAKNKKSYLQVGKNKIQVEIASTKEQVTRGLSNRASLPENSGMYFILGERKQTTFWMKEMRFSIDIIWIDANRIVGIEKNAPVPNGGVISTFTSPTAVTNVLELNAGWSEKNNVKLDEPVKIIKN